ncbi:protein translocase subunit SecD [Diplocloster modestus]|uniref:Multifunctional fusion protein n=1 Tax=Diplocloster modestus TaxID=2850322 RepID=A0ABS6KE76_9FIRM|nr:protein translocase subunit SecD [Diplocloster modestus]MBU9728783.1 protein translocase subunit SecD [Diplocloster modestus]
MKKSRGIIVLILAALITAGMVFTAAVGIGDSESGAIKHIKLGLDLAGGVSITYESVEENPTAEQMSDTIYKLQKRVETYSTEAQVYQEGDRRINIEIPGVSDANAILEELGKPGSLLFQTQDGEVILDGSHVTSAKAGNTTDKLTGNNNYVVQLTFDEEGKEKFAEATQANIGNRIAIVYDGNTVSAPTVKSAITNGECVIENMESYEAAESLASTIRIGSLQLELKEIRSNVVGAQLGEEAISTSLKAGAIGIALVVIFMVIFYLIPGLAAGLALVIYTLLVLLTLNAFEITLTLPGIAGIILSIGMAVDANVIIFARIREEIAAGRNVKSAMKEGFRKAMSAIVDGNITTLIAAAVLYLFGSGSVRGFAQTLALGIVLSMFTALVITRLILNAFYAVGLKDKKFFGQQKERKAINFIGKRNLFFAISIALILIGFVFMGVHSAKGTTFNYSLDFMGGTSTNVTFNEDMSIQEVDANVKPVVQEITKDANIQTQKVAGTNQVIIKTRELNLSEREALNNALKENFGVDESLITAESISSTVSKEMRWDAFKSVLIATLCMLIYIWIRFNDLRFGASAVIALIHDVLVVIGCYAVVRIPVGGTFIACMLTIVGYSINATIVIFDRIRENLKLMKNKESLHDVVNKSVTQTLSRSINTTVTTFITIAVLFILGVSSIREFAFPLMVGIICGGYTSVCITGALWYVMKTKLVKKEK